MDLKACLLSGHPQASGHLAYEQGMPPSSPYIAHPLGQPINAHGRTGARSCSIAKRAKLVSAPGERLAILRQRSAVARSGSYLHISELRLSSMHIYKAHACWMRQPKCATLVTSAARLSASTRVGSARSLSSPTPSWPSLFQPHAYTAPVQHSDTQHAKSPSRPVLATIKRSWAAPASEQARVWLRPAAM